MKDIICNKENVRSLHVEKLISCCLFLFLFKFQFAQQVYDSTQLKIGSSAPSLMVSEWLTDQRIDSFQKGKVYVVEFWATWCPPCIRIIPHLSKLAKKYKKEVSVVSVNTYPLRLYPKAKAEHVIDSMVRRLHYMVAFDDGEKTAESWLKRTWGVGVPSTYVVNGDGIIVWIGYPTGLDSVLTAVLNNKWDMAKAASERIYRQQLFERGDSTRDILHKFYRNGNPGDFYGEPDSMLVNINRMLQVDPQLAYTREIARYKFDALLKTDMNAAHTYALEAVDPSNPMGPNWVAIVQGIDYLSKHLTIKKEIYRLGADLLNAYSIPFPSTLIQIADWYWLSGDKAKAREMLKKARRSMKRASSNNYGVFFD